MPSPSATSAEPRDQVFASATEYSEDEHKPENQPESDRAKHDQANVTPSAYLLVCRGAGVLHSIGRGRHNALG